MLLQASCGHAEKAIVVDTWTVALCFFLFLPVSFFLHAQLPCDAGLADAQAADMSMRR